MNNLSQRLKYAKRELTALKTAHPRGLGNLRVYRRSETAITPGTSGLYYGTVTATFSSQFSPYPYVQAVLGPMPENVNILQIEDFEYSSDGMGFTTIMGGWFTAGSIPITFEILSLAPVETVSIQWREL